MKWIKITKGKQSTEDGRFIAQLEYGYKISWTLTDNKELLNKFGNCSLKCCKEVAESIVNKELRG